MGKSDLEAFLKVKANKKQEEKIDWDKRRKDWLKHIEQFYSNIQKWLKSYQEQGLLKIEFEVASKSEEYLGEYKTENMHIFISDQKVTLKPIGSMIIGARGRIDMVGTAGRIKFLLVNKETTKPIIKFEIKNGAKKEERKERQTENKEVNFTWKIATPPPNIQFIKLNQDSFSDCLMEVLK